MDTASLWMRIRQIAMEVDNIDLTPSEPCEGFRSHAMTFVSKHQSFLQFRKP